MQRNCERWKPAQKRLGRISTRGPSSDFIVSNVKCGTRFLVQKQEFCVLHCDMVQLPPKGPLSVVLPSALHRQSGTWIALSAGKRGLSSGQVSQSLSVHGGTLQGFHSQAWSVLEAVRLCFWPDVKAQEIMLKQAVVLLLSGISLGHRQTLAKES